MNERIQELIPQAYDMVRKNHNGYFTQELLLGCMAELIVAECIDTIDPKTGTKWIKDQTREEFWKNQSVHLIKKHFGVE